MATTPLAPGPATRRISRRGLVIFIVAAIAILVATVVGIRGLLASPVQSVAADGTATLHGTWEPYSCDSQLCQGYVQAGGGSVFVVLASGCPAPGRAADVTIVGRPDSSLGKASYRSVGCPR
jgi:type 1 fimbria pilin